MVAFLLPLILVIAETASQSSTQTAWAKNKLPLQYVEIRNSATKTLTTNGDSTTISKGYSGTLFQIRSFNFSSTLFNIVNLYTGNCLVETTSGRISSALYTTPPSNPSTMQWSFTLVDSENYSWSIMSVSSKLYLTASGSSVILSQYIGAASQAWQFFPPVPVVGRPSLWTQPIQLPLVAIAATNLPDGRVLVWSSSQVANYGTGQLQTYSAIYNPVTGSVSESLITSLQADMFCPGTALLFDGSETSIKRRVLAHRPPQALFDS